MSKYFKSLKEKHIPLDPVEPKEINEQFQEWYDGVTETEAEMLKRLREERGWSHGVLATKLGLVDEEALIRMEKGSVPIPYEVGLKLGQIFNVDSRFFLR